MIENCAGPDGNSRSASLTEILNNRPSLAAPAACAPQGALNSEEASLTRNTW